MQDEQKEQPNDVPEKLPGAPDDYEGSVMQKYMNTNVAGDREQTQDDGSQIGAVIVFKKGITEAEAHEVLDRIEGQLESRNVQEFYPKFGHPAFYIP